MEMEQNMASIHFVSHNNLQPRIHQIISVKRLGLLPKEGKCPTCKHSLKKKKNEVKRAGKSRGERRFHCSKKKSKSKLNQISIRKNTWFENSHIPFHKSHMLIIYSFIQKLSYKLTVHETSISSADSEIENENNPFKHKNSIRLL